MMVLWNFKEIRHNWPEIQKSFSLEDKHWPLGQYQQFYNMLRSKYLSGTASQVAVHNMFALR